MKNVFLGLLLGGALTAGIIWFALVPGVRETAYNTGFAAGNAAGSDAGMKAGIVEGLEQAREKVIADSMKVEELNRRAKEAAAAQKRRTKPQPVQNWHVISGRIADPISNNNDQQQ